MLHLTVVIVRLAVATTNTSQRLVTVLVDAVAWTRAHGVVVGVNLADLVEFTVGFTAFAFSVCLLFFKRKSIRDLE